MKTINLIFFAIWFLCIGFIWGIGTTLFALGKW
jgi:hypothetical protein